jgi:hypothetical protein
MFKDRHKFPSSISFMSIDEIPMPPKPPTPAEVKKRNREIAEGAIISTMLGGSRKPDYVSHALAEGNIMTSEDLNKSLEDAFGYKATKDDGY